MVKQLNEQTHCGWCGAAVTHPSEWMSVCSGCGFKNYLSSKPCSDLLIVKGDKVAALKRAMDPDKGKYNFPGGFMDLTDASMEDCAYRELEEELGVPRSQVASLEYFDSAMNDYVWMDTIVPCACFIYICKLKDYTFDVDTEESHSVRWIGVDDLPDVDFAWDIDRNMVTKYFKEKHGRRNN